MPLVDLEWAADVFLEEASRAGVGFADFRGLSRVYRLVAVDDDGVREASWVETVGVGVRVVGPGVGYSAVSRVDRGGLREAIERAARAARAGGKVEFYTGAWRDRASSPYARDPLEVPTGDLVELASSMRAEAAGVKGVVSASARIGVEAERRVYASTEGGWVVVESRLVGGVVSAVARGPAGLESAWDGESRSAGWEFIERTDWAGLARGVGELAVQLSNARAPEPGFYTVVLDPDIVGILLHEALGHPVEGDSVSAGGSVVAGKLGERIAPETVTIVDDGLHPDGVFVPYDDEGVRKGETVIVERGVLKGYLSGRLEAPLLGGEPTGNGRAATHRHPILVRQTNFYMKPGDWDDEEIVRETRDGILATYRGGRGGQTDPGSGTFTFSLGASWRIRNGEIAEPLRGVVAAGSILDMLASIDAVGREVRVRTSVFGGCGKFGQLVRVGDGGPRVRTRLSIGGSRQ